jgi:hypothetical protein
MPSPSPSLLFRTPGTAAEARGNSTILSATSPRQCHSSLTLLVQKEAPLPYSPNCMCRVCHLKVTIFPRRQDGKIILPSPSFGIGLEDPSVHVERNADRGKGSHKVVPLLSGTSHLPVLLWYPRFNLGSTYVHHLRQIKLFQTTGILR